MIAGPAGAGTFINLANGYQEVMKQHPGIQIVYKREVGLTREAGLKQAEDILVAHPDVAAIYGANDEVALGAAQAVKAAGKGGKVIVTAMNGTPPGVRGVKAGDLSMTVEINPVAWGKLGVETADAMLKGKTFDQKVYIGTAIIDASNIDAAVAKLPPPPR
jgi:ABC-type sugar transport system substrate-binding protein